MKCSKCGFVISDEFERCPYCGSFVGKKTNNPLETNIKLGNKVPVKVKAFLYVILFNVLVAGVLADWFLDFKYGITILAYFLSIGIIVFSSIISKKNSPLTAYEKIDLFLNGLIILLIGLGKIDGTSIDIRAISVAIILPSSLIVSNIFMIVALLSNRKEDNKMHPIFTLFIVFIHLTFSCVLFAFTLVNKYSNITDISTAPFPYLYQYNDVSSILCYIAFGFNALFFVNFFLVFIAFIISKVRSRYGNKND